MMEQLRSEGSERGPDFSAQCLAHSRSITRSNRQIGRVASHSQFPEVRWNQSFNAKSSDCTAAPRKDATL